MPQGYKDFVAGNGLAAADLEDYAELQSTMRFASAAARDTALATVKVEGMRAYLIDVNTETIYTGAAWSTIGPVHGAQSTWVPTLTQNVTPTFTIVNATHCRIGRRIMGEAEILLTAGTPGTAGNGIIVGLPVAHALTVNTVIGTGMLFDQSAGFKYRFVLVAGATSTTARGYDMAVLSDSFEGVTGFGAALTTSDFIAYNFNYPAAGDA